MRPRGGRGLTPPLADGPLAGGPGGLAPAGPAHKTAALLSFPSFKGLRLTGEGEGTAGPARGGQWEPSGVCKGRRRARRAGVHGPSSRRAEDASPRSWGTGGRLRLCPLRATTCTAVTSQRGHRRCRSAHRIYGKRPPPPGTRHAAAHAGAPATAGLLATLLGAGGTGRLAGVRSGARPGGRPSPAPAGAEAPGGVTRAGRARKRHRHHNANQLS